MAEEKKRKIEQELPKNPPRAVNPVSKKVQTVNIMFRERRKFDLHVGRNMLTFRGRESKPVQKSWIEHKDFQQVVCYMFFGIMNFCYISFKNKPFDT